MRHDIITDEPYFMTNEKWYYFDEKEWKYKLTKEAPAKAVKSYKDFYRELDYGSSQDKDGK